MKHMTTLAAVLLASTTLGASAETLKWARANELRDYPMPPADIPLIPLLRDWL